MDSSSTLDNTSITIDEEFKALLWPLSAVEFSHLEQSILADGCRDRLTVWREGNLLVDGHNRHQVCTAHGLEFGVDYRDFPNREAVLDWIDKNQAARRNCAPEEYRIITGRIYNRRKKAVSNSSGVNQHAEVEDQFDIQPTETTAEQVAAEFGVSAPTIMRNGQRAEVYDSMLAIGDTEAAKAAATAPQAVIAEVRKVEPEVAAEALKAKPHVSNNSGVEDWYTPPEFIESARNVLGEIDLDPASSEVAQGFVKATEYFTRDDDGLIQDWSGRVWLNPPYSAGIVEKFAEKLIDSLNSAAVKSAVVLVNNATDTRWFHLLANSATAICFVRGRIKFLDSTGEPKNSPLQGQAFLYYGRAAKRFMNEFKVYGFCVEGILSDC